MDYLGKRVKRESGGSTGTVRSYDSSRGLFKIEYDGGDSEELEAVKVAGLLLDDSVSGNGNICFRTASSVELDLNADLNEGLDLNCVGKGGLDLNANINSDAIIDLNMDASEVVRGEEGLNERKAYCFDLNLELGEEMKESCEVAGGDPPETKEDGCSDGYVEVFVENSAEMICGQSVNVMIECTPVELEMNNSLSNGLGFDDVVPGCAPKRRRGRKKKVHSDTNINLEGQTKFTESHPVQIESKAPLSDGCTGVGLNTDVVAVSMPKKRRGRKRKVPLDTDAAFVVKAELPERNSVELVCKNPSFNDVPATGLVSNIGTVSASSTRGRRGRKRKIQLDADTNSAVKTESSERDAIENELGISSCNDDIASGLKSNTDTPVGSPGGRRGRKRKVSSNTNTVAAPDTVLRRSTRRARNSVIFTENNVIHTVVSSDNVKDMSSSPSASAVTEEKFSEILGQEGIEEQNALPPKVQLPPSSGNLDLGDMPVIDLFSVYSFLRSFSSLLFLSPFELEDFVSSVNCNASSSLIDSIHVSLLNTLRKHLESVPDEISQSASECLRCHNWDLLDMITWPIFMADYLLTYSSGLKPGFDLCSLKLLESDYYEQSPSVKIEILRCLCDDVIEVDCVKSEINKRSLVTEPNVDFDRSTKFDYSKRRKDVTDITGSCVTEDNTDETVDWNSDECCLCKLDGNLICCDGCPAAFHSRCVGVISNHLPEGDWYCPECMIDKDKSGMKLGKAMRGAEFLGADAYGWMYYSCCGYLLVLEDSQNASSSKYYLRDDLPAVVEVLKSSVSVNYRIMNAVVKHWDLLSDVDGEKKDCGLREGKLMQRSQHSVICTKVGEVVAEDASLVSATTGGEVPKLGIVKADTGNHGINLGDIIICSEGSADGSLAVNLSTRARVSNRLGTRRKVSVLSKLIEGKNTDPEKSGPDVYTINSKIVSPSNCYVNYYSLAQTASAISDEFSRKSSTKDSEKSLKSLDDILLGQMKAISDKYIEFYWPNMLNAQVDASKENCGWCFPCKVPEVERQCLISMYSCNSSLENFTSEALGICLKNTKISHLVDVMCHICCIEERLRGLLLGPWLNPQYSKFWRNSLLGASGIASVKDLLLKIESNLRPLALSADWTKHVDSAVSVGSGVHIVTTSTRCPSRNSVVRKRARCPEPEAVTTSNTASGLGLLWWRGGRLSRRLFNWKVVPCALASKAARQGGCRKIPGLLYPDGSEFAKRSRFVAWQAGVESSKSVEQLALHVRDFDANIRWDEIENNIVSLKLEKESKKPVKSFKKVIVRKKCIEGTLVKYLLDFGKRRFIPDVVLKFGSKIEESLGERKKFWLKESHLPLHLLKSFEQKRLARKTNQLNLGKLPENTGVVNQSTKRKGFSYLFSRAERSENYQCGHCNKDVLIREAVCCQFCKGFFHKRHVRKSAGSITSQITYTCHKCQANKYVGGNSRKKNLESRKIKKPSKDSKQLRPLLSKPRKLVGGTKAVQGNKQLRKNQKNKKVTVVVPLRRSPRKTRSVLLQSKKIRAHKKGKRRKSKNRAPKKPLNSPWQKKRSQCYPLFWLNGLHLSRKPNDERVLQYKRKNLLVLSENPAGEGQQPKCSLCCELEFSPKLIYIACELCGEWFHGDALDLREEQIDVLVGFKCHVCLGRSPPCCPYLGALKVEETNLAALSDHYELDDIPEDAYERMHKTPKIDEIGLEGVCNPCTWHDQQPCELLASDDGTSVQKAAVHLADPPGESQCSVE